MYPFFHRRNHLLLVGGFLLGFLLLGQSQSHAQLPPGNDAQILSPAADLRSSISTFLKDLPQPTGTLDNPQPVFHAASFGQTMLNFQAEINAPNTEIMAQQVVTFYRCELAGTGCQKSGLGYRERKMNTIVAQWGFNLVLDPPPQLKLTPKKPDKQVVLVVQGVVLSPQTININLRYEEL